MGFPFHCHQNVRSHLRGDIYRKIQLPGSVLVGPVRAVIGRFPQTSSTLLGVLTRVLLPILLTLLALMAPFQNSRAQTVDTSKAAPQNLKQLSLEQLGNLEVTTVSKVPAEIQRTAAAIYVLTQEDIRRSGATSIPEALRLVPGVEVAQIDSSSWAVGIRGFGNAFSKSVLVLIDGRSVYTPLFAGVNWKLQNVMLEDVERIEVIRGPGGTIWGTNAVNGVINIITKNSKDTRGTLISLGGGNVDQGTGEFRQGGSLGRNANYRVYGMAFGRGPELHTDHDNFDDWQLGQGGFRVDWDNQGRDTFTLQGDIYKGGVGARQNLAYYSPPASINVDGIQDVSGGNILGRWRRKLSEKSDFQLQAYYDRTYRFGSQLGENRNTFDIDFLHQFKALPRQDIIWGLGARWSPSDFTQTIATVDFLPHHKSDNIYSVFVQDEIAIVQNKLSATIGSKFEHNIYTGWEIQPSARLLWTPNAHQTVWAAVTRAVRSPSRLDEDLQLTGLITTTPLPIFIRVAGNPQFMSETLLGYEVGYRTLVTSKFFVDVSLFHNNYNNLTSFGSAKISFENSPPPLRVILTVPWANGIKGSTDGFEIAPNWKVASWLVLNASYSYLNMDLSNKPGNTDTGTVTSDQGSSPRHEFVIRTQFNLPKRFEFDPAFRYVSALPAQLVESYSTMDVHLSWRFTEQMELSVVGKNLFQPQHAEFAGDPGGLIGIKRSVYAKIIWTSGGK
jgi:iron complex outermembrane receptor protein